MSRSFFGPPPTLPGEVEARAAAHAKARQRTAAYWEARRVAASPGGEARARAESFLLQEAHVLRLIDVTDDPVRKQELVDNAAELRRLADEQIKEAEHAIMTTTAREIRARMRARLVAIGQRLAAVRAEDDEKFPVEHQAKRGMERDLLWREWQQVEAAELDAYNGWAQEAHARALALYESDPVGDAAHESRRVADNLEIAGLAQRYVGQTTSARNHLLPEVRRYIALGMLDKASIHLEAAQRVGVIDPTLDEALTAARDVTIPHRRQALQQMQQIRDERDLFDHARYSARIAHGVGRAIEADNALKLLAARQGVPTPAGMLTPSTIPTLPGGDSDTSG